MTRYELFLFLHIVFAIVWLGAGTTIQFLVVRAQRAGDPAEFGRLGAVNEWLTPRLFIPSSLLVLLFGIALVLDGPWSFGDLWVLIGLGGYAVSFLAGILLLEPTSKKMKNVMAAEGPHSPEAARLADRLTVVSRTEVVLLYVVVADMAFKPTIDNGWTLAGFAAALAAGPALFVWLQRRQSAAARPEAAHERT